MHRFFFYYNWEILGPKLGKISGNLRLGLGLNLTEFHSQIKSKKKKPRGIGHFQINFNLLK